GIPMTDDLIENHYEAAKGIMKAELEATRIQATDHQRTLDLVQEEDDLRYFNRSSLNWGEYRPPPIVENVERLQFATDFERLLQPVVAQLGRVPTPADRRERRTPPVRDRLRTGHRAGSVDEADRPAVPHRPGGARRPTSRRPL
ncbi:nitrate/sulfonate/bicarbonate ABC transporter periplasmic component-like protein, partial [Halococcus hamelinensis 100A6]